MPQTAPDQLKLIDMRRPAARALLVLPVVLALLASWFAVRWYVGGFVAEYAPNMEEGQLDTALAAMRMAPDDPWTHAVVAALRRKSFLPEDLADAARRMEEAVRLSPNDYRLWLELGRAREELGEREAGEKALRRAVELAPSYAYPHWHLGNMLVRAGRPEEAFAEIRKAADSDPRFRGQMFNLAWELYGQDAAATAKAVGDSGELRADFVIYLVGRGRVDEALSLWSALSPDDKKKWRASASTVGKALVELKRYRDVLAIYNEMNPGSPASVGQLFNGGFEQDVDPGAGNIFDWQVKSDPQAQVAIDSSMHHGGSRSLRVLFKVSGNISIESATQFVVVSPSTQYRFECYVRAEDLKSGSTPYITITDAADDKAVLGTPQTLPAGSYDWQPLTIDFRTTPKTEAVVVRIGRATCGDPVCPIFGTVWYDDFNLQLTGGAPDRRHGGGSQSGG